ncbi:MAG: adenosylmethionine--8-amino-7-oxononanoate transaminase [Chitinophagales bacterium]|nr:adenosylmethionine--8-amino-7-oxononanoate transaminase [Chitinophagales bacterium]
MKLTERDKQYIWHPYTQAKTERSPIPVVKGKGAWLTDENGKKYLDAISSWWVNIHGHAHPYIAKKIAEQAKQLEQVIFAGFTHEPAVRLAERIVRLLPGDYAKVFYSDNGSTAVEVALKMAIQYWHNKGIQKTKIITFKDGYHGDTFGAMSASGRGIFTNPFTSLLFDVIHIEPPLPGKEKQSIEQLKAAIGSGRRQPIPNDSQPATRNSQTSCFLFEPLVLGAGGMLMYDAEPLDKMISICRKNNILTIADEVMTGFGRTGKLFATEYLENQPDIICLSKGITGGFMPLGLTVCTEEIYQAFYSDDRAKTFFHGHSYTANPLACAAANASLDLVEKKGFKQSLKRIQSRHVAFAKKLVRNPKIENVRTRGTILAFDLKTKDATSYLNKERARIYDFFIERGILLRPLGNTIYVMPPYCITENELAFVYAEISRFADSLLS